jgi:FixJ family two-component response regulator
MRAADQRIAPKNKTCDAESSSGDLVCLVDDDPSIRRSVSRLLQSAGFRVNAFAEAEPFLGYLAENSVPVVVLDIWLERMTGMELLAQLCSRSPQTRVIFITGHEDPAARATVMNAGAFGFLTKPFDGDVFLNLVARAFDRATP